MTVPACDTVRTASYALSRAEWDAIGEAAEAAGVAPIGLGFAALHRLATWPLFCTPLKGDPK